MYKREWADSNIRIAGALRPYLINKLQTSTKPIYYNLVVKVSETIKKRAALKAMTQNYEKPKKPRSQKSQEAKKPKKSRSQKCHADKKYHIFFVSNFRWEF